MSVWSYNPVTEQWSRDVQTLRLRASSCAWVVGQRDGVVAIGPAWSAEDAMAQADRAAIARLVCVS